MKAAKYMDEAALIKKSIEVLAEKVGPVETIRFISMPRKKRMESVRRHREWQSMLDRNKFFDKVFGKLEQG